MRNGGIVLPRPLALPDGTEVVVRVEPLASRESEVTADPPVDREELAGVPFFGMWEGRADMGDGATWVRAQRERWARAHPAP